MTSGAIVIHSDRQDVVAAALSGIGGISVIHLDELTSAWPVQEATPITPMDFDRIRTSCQGYVINRVFDLSCCEIGTRLRNCGLHENWAHAALGVVLGQAVALAHGIGPRGVSRSRLPLNAQWKLIADRAPGINVPLFAFGFGHRMPDISHLQDPVQKSVWSYFRWDGESDVTEGEDQWHPFFVERPDGMPVICSYHGEAIDLEFPRGPVAINGELLSTLVVACRETFDSRMGEVLFYQKDERVTFYAFSPYMASVGDSKRIRDLLLRGMPFAFA